MSPSTRSRVHNHRPARLGGALLAIGAALTAGALVALPSAVAATRPGSNVPARVHPQPRASIGNPVTGNQGFTVFVHGNATVSSNENEGTMALGGNLTLGDNYRVANHPPTHPFTAPGDAQPTGLLIGGGINWVGSAATGQLQVLSSTYVKLGNAAGTDVVNNGLTELVPTGAGSGSAKRVSLTTTQSTTSIEQSGLIDFDSAFAAYGTRSDAMANCPDTVVMTNANGNPLTSPLPPGSQVYLNVSSTETNVWTVNASDLNNIANLTLRGTLSASAPLVINVVGVHGAFTWNPPSLGGFSSTNAPYVLWNFPDTTTLNLTGSNTIEGTVFAPRASLIDLNPGNVEGNVIVDAYQQGGSVGGINGGEVHDFPFAGDINCGSSESPSASPTETSASPSPTETSASASPSATETSESPSASPSPTETSASPSPSATETSESPSPSPTETSESASPSPTETSASPSPTETSASPTVSPSASPTETSASPTPTPGPTTPTAHPTPSVSPTRPSPTTAVGSAGQGPGRGSLATTGVEYVGVALLLGLACLGLGTALTMRTRRTR